jgi:hypothetical protein
MSCHVSVEQFQGPALFHAMALPQSWPRRQDAKRFLGIVSNDLEHCAVRVRHVDRDRRMLHVCLHSISRVNVCAYMMGETRLAAGYCTV